MTLAYLVVSYFALGAAPEVDPKQPRIGHPSGHADAFVRCSTTAGNFTLEVHKTWAPNGYARFTELVNDKKFFKDQLLYRVISRFVVQFGSASDPAVQKKYQDDPIGDDPSLGIPFEAGVLSFAGHGPGSRTSHMFIADEPRGKHLGSEAHERPLGRIFHPMELVFLRSCYSEYGDLASEQHDLIEKGNEAFAEKYPLLDKIYDCSFITRAEASAFAHELNKAEKERVQGLLDEEARAAAEVKRAADELDATKAAVGKLLEEKAPKMLKKLDRLLEHWQGKEAELLASLRAKHGVRSDEEL
ncbi:hypothetical protein DIPPA_00700 [Diplonema papillatum]|nr:hypothetical protein DIPPA_00700 [Diplonema papillatum]